MILKVKSKKNRSKSGLILLEGRRLINDACLAGITPLMVFFSRKKDIEEIKIPVGVKLYKTPYKELQLWSDLSTCPGIMALCKVPDLKSATDNSLPIVVICDQVREPGNLGAIIRNSAAAGVSTIILTPGCTDLWDPKVLRAGSGAHFKVPILRDETWTNISEILPQNTKLLIADSPSIEKLPLIPYYTINYTKWNHIAVVIGGETEGLSDNAIHLAEEMKGDRITIPMSNDIDSLNCAAAVSVILFEIRRQMVV
ncbi:hypothetical protein AAG570_000597 [Ranatra chinensis]|uniref:RNA methyltransferase n=1 Tax=Ranatra chinensis TaxID=642074 RepID=A0ABD0Z7W9_9HEMI